MKSKGIKVIALTTISIIVCFLSYFSGYRHGYKTAGYKYYYDGMKVQYNYKRIQDNFVEMSKIMDSIYAGDSDVAIYNNTFQKVGVDTDTQYYFIDSTSYFWTTGYFVRNDTTIINIDGKTDTVIVAVREEPLIYPFN